jgi:excisionase family DNA binding protein
MEDILYTVSEVAKLIKTNPAYVYKLINAGHLRVLKLGSLKVRRTTLLEFLEKNEGYDLTNPHDVTQIVFNDQEHETAFRSHDGHQVAITSQASSMDDCLNRIIPFPYAIGGSCGFTGIIFILRPDLFQSAISKDTPYHTGGFMIAIGVIICGLACLKDVHKYLKLKNAKDDARNHKVTQ